MLRVLLAMAVVALAARAFGDGLPRPIGETEMVPWGIPYGPEVPGVMAVEALTAKPAGTNGGVVVRDGHFYTGDQRLRLWGVNLCFSADFPTHDEADRLARRLARFGLNAVRFHHMDNRKFPGGIFADNKLQTLAPEALDRLDYFLAALKREGVYADLNLHVSREWSKAQRWPNADKLPTFDKTLDIFNADLLQANQKYARALLTHVNPYTKTRLADDPAVAVVEINNEDSLFMWDSERQLETLPEPYAAELQALWNRWLTAQYATREKLQTAWAAGAQPVGANLLDADLSGRGASPWVVERHAPADMAAAIQTRADKTAAVKLTVKTVTPTDWHLQFFQPGLRLKKGQVYTLEGRAAADQPATITLSVGQSHEPFANLGFVTRLDLAPEERPFRFMFTATSDDDNARVSFIVGQKPNTLTLAALSLRPGGRAGLWDSEDPARGTVARMPRATIGTPARTADWYDFLQQTDEKYFVEMRRFLKEELGVKAPITGTIVLGALGALSQSKMDFVDAHNYWQHPYFPHKDWDMNDWRIANTPMVDHPDQATLPHLACLRLAGKPFTVTEYNHPAPNEWQAEALPLVASYAALQDWDGVFLFAYSHGGKYEKDHAESFFDIEGNPLKMGLLPLASRLFLGGVIPPLAATRTMALDRATLLRTAYPFHHDLAGLLRQEFGLQWEDLSRERFAISFTPAPPPTRSGPQPLAWSAHGAGTGAYRCLTDRAAVWVGFPQTANPAGEVPLGPVTLRTANPYVTAVLTPADSRQTLDKADRLLLAMVGRGANTGMVWNDKRDSIGKQWGKAPTLIETIRGTLAAPNGWTIYPLNSTGLREETKKAAGTLDLHDNATMWFELVRNPR